MDGPARSFGILSTFPPTACGIATFSAALAAGLVANGGTVDVVRCGVTPAMEDPLVLASLDDATPDRVAAAVDVLDRTDVAIIQHEYGIYGGPDGDEVLAVLDAIVVPSIVVAHVVVANPTPNQRFVLERVCDLADSVVVMTESARVRLIDGFDCRRRQDRRHPARRDDATHRRPGGRRTTEPTGPPACSRGVCSGRARASSGRSRPSPAWPTCDPVRHTSSPGRRTRRCWHTAARRTGRCSSPAPGSSGSSPYVTFDDTYRDLAALTELISSADLVVLPYDSKDQVTSGVLVDAVAAGRPVVSTAFPHAVELLASGAGLVVPQRDPDALAAAIRSVVTDAELADEMAAEARRLAPELSWNAIAGRYDRLAARLLASHERVNA